MVGARRRRRGVQNGFFSLFCGISGARPPSRGAGAFLRDRTLAPPPALILRRPEWTYLGQFWALVLTPDFRISSSKLTKSIISDPGTIRVLLRFGADPSLKCRSEFGGGELITPEEEASRRIHPRFASAGRLRESLRLLRDARLLRPRLRQIFALRALCHRGRAAPTPDTPAAFARLIGSAPASQPRTRAATRVRAGTRARTRAKIPSSPGLPDPLAHLVCLFWLGRPPRRANRAAPPASE